MIKKITIKNFKKFENASYEVNQTSVTLFVGPNNGGKTTALQAIALWSFLISEWNETKGKASKSRAKKRTGAPITRNKIYAVPVQDMKFLWFNAITQDAKQQKVDIQIIAEGIDKDGKDWEYGIEFNYGGPEIAYSKPLEPEKEIPDDAFNVFHLPPLSGVQTQERKVEIGAQRHIIGEGRPGEILRNLLLQVQEKGRWDDLSSQVKSIFQVELEPIAFNPKTDANILVNYRPETWVRKKSRGLLEISSGGSGFLQFLLVTAFLYAHENSVLLIDEPDSHMHVRLQQGMYDWLQRIALANGVQLLISTHSEVIINSTNTENIYTFFGESPRKIEGKKQQIIDAMKTVSAVDILNAQDKKFVLFTEGINDLRILKTFANRLQHEIRDELVDIFFETTGDNRIDGARDKFKELCIVEKNLKGFFIRDDVGRTSPEHVPPKLQVRYWGRKEIENYLIIPSVLERFIKKQDTSGELFMLASLDSAKDYLHENLPPKLYKDPLSNDINGKGSDFLEKFFKEIHLRVDKGDYWKIADVMEKEDIHQDIIFMLDELLASFKSAKELTENEKK